ncbi:hypothetical protein MMC16_002933 [Acarospora aff. strigata]|nr:hypothetical protein [Acarospora aff. strigata]
MERDLATLQAHHAKRDEEASSGQTISVAEADVKLPLKSQESTPHQVPSIKIPKEDREAVDVVMTDDPVKVEVLGAEQEGAKMLDTPFKVESLAIEDKGSLDPPPQVQLAPVNAAVSKDDTNATPTQTGAVEEAGNGINADIPVAESELSAGMKDVNFESMFDDAAGDGTNDEIGFGMDFPSGPGNAQALIDNDPFGPNDSNREAPTIPTATDEDIDSLLPGLESFAHAADDFAMGHLDTASTSVENAVTTDSISMPMTTTADVPPDLLPPESNFDDMFFDSANFTMEEGNGGETGGDDVFGEIGDFDESWFKTDGI